MSIQDQWDKAEQTGETIDIGNTVICDICNKDYTESDESGGFIFGSKAYCPECNDRGMRKIISYKEEHFIQAICSEGQSFRAFVLEARGGNNTIRITTMKLEDL